MREKGGGRPKGQVRGAQISCRARDVAAFSSTVLSHFCQQVKEFFSSLDEKSARLRCVQQAMEAIEDNIQWMDRNLEKVKIWLQNNHL